MLFRSHKNNLLTYFHLLTRTEQQKEPKENFGENPPIEASPMGKPVGFPERMLVCFPTKQDSFYQQHDAVDCKSDQTSNQHVCHDGSGFHSSLSLNH